MKLTILTILKCAVQWHLVLSQCYVNITFIWFPNIFITSKEDRPFKQSLPKPFPLPQAITNLLFVLCGFAYSGYFIQWNHATCCFFCSAASLSMFSRFIHVTAFISTAVLFMLE